MNTVNRLYLKVALVAIGAMVVLLALNQRFNLIPALTFTRLVRPSEVTTLHSIQEVGELVSLRVRVEKVVEAGSSLGFADFLFGDRLLLVASANASLGIDLAALGEDDITLERQDGKTVATIDLPEIVLLDVALDEANTRVYSREQGWLRFEEDIGLEGAARQSAVTLITDEVDQSETYRDLARRNAEQVIRGLLEPLGVDTVEFNP